MKKVRIREKEGDLDNPLVVGSSVWKALTWKDRLLGTGLLAKDQASLAIDSLEEGDFKLSETDVFHSLVSGIPSIDFSNRVNQILIKEMAQSVVIKLLGRSIGYLALYYKVCSLRKLSRSTTPIFGPIIEPEY